MSQKYFRGRWPDYQVSYLAKARNCLYIVVIDSSPGSRCGWFSLGSTFTTGFPGNRTLLEGSEVATSRREGFKYRVRASTLYRKHLRVLLQATMLQ